MQHGEIAKDKTRVLIIGVGNIYRRDDAVGLIAARHLRAMNLDDVGILQESGEGAALMKAWQDANTVILIDAVHSGAAPGTIHRLDAHAHAIPTDFFHYSTHAFSVAEAIELARALHQLPSQFIIYGIEGKDFEAGEGLSPVVKKAVREVVHLVLRDLRL